MGSIDNISDPEIQHISPMLITIDGPAGAGKTTISRELSRVLGYRYLDTGALYRGVALKVLQSGVSMDDDKEMRGLLEQLNFEIRNESDNMRLICNNADITEKIRTPEISMAASAVSAKLIVRDFLMDIQRSIGQEKKVVAEGRDMGTVVFPGADVKFFLDASLEIRARRRFDELKDANPETLEEVEEAMMQRDANDSGRSLAPLKPAQDAHIIDSSDMTPQQVVKKMVGIVKSNDNKAIK